MVNDRSGFPPAAPACPGRRRDQGMGVLGLFLTCALFLLSGYGALKIGPPLFSHYQLKGAVERIVKYSSSGVLAQTRFSAGPAADSPGEISKAILSAAREMRIPLRPEQVRVRKVQGALTVSVEYAVPIEFPGGVYQLRLGLVEEN